jgi:hypothetical protein
LKARIEGDVDGVLISEGAITFNALNEVVKTRNAEEAEKKRMAKAAAAGSPPAVQDPVIEAP